MTKDEEFLKRLLATFKIEAEEHVSGISAGLIELEKQPSPERQKEIIELVFREAHSLKGAARSVNLSTIEQVCQALESLLALLKRGETGLTTPLFDLLNDAVDVLNRLLATPDTTLPPEDRSHIQAIRQRLADAATGRTVPAKTNVRSVEPQPKVAAVVPESMRRPPDEEEKPRFEAKQPAPGEKSVPISDTIRIPSAKLDSLLLKAEELVSAKLAVRQHASLARELKSMLDTWKQQWSKASHEKSTSQKEFLELNQTFGKNLENKLQELVKGADDDVRSIGGMVDSMLDEMKSVMMFPFSSVLTVFPKLVRDLSREQGKEIDLVIQGGEIEIDKRILQEIKDPLIHLVRNCVDHGLETAEARKEKGKPGKGSLKIIISQKDSGKVEISIGDDGGGIHIDKVKGSALRQGLVTEEQTEHLSHDETLNLIFESGLSTSPLITTVSGRGLGMAIVREKIERLGGTIAVQTAPDAGTTFSILLPLSLARFRGILIETGGQVFAVPTMNVERIGRILKDEVKNVENRETIELNGIAVALVRLDQILELSPQPSDEADPALTVMVLSTGDKYLAFAIDHLLYEDEILLKSLGKQLARVRNISGATVLGSGKVVPILNVSDLVKSVSKISVGTIRSAASGESTQTAKTQAVLVVEDSITARTLFVNILESAGYHVTAAVDGVDGFTKLTEGEFDLVVTDIAMPRMNGFELTQKIRADNKYGDIPVVIVTGLESHEDKKRGIEVGANAYLVKSSFDQSNLVEVIKRLI